MVSISIRCTRTKWKLMRLSKNDHMFCLFSCEMKMRKKIIIKSEKILSLFNTDAICPRATFICDKKKKKNDDYNNHSKEVRWRFYFVHSCSILIFYLPRIANHEYHITVSFFLFHPTSMIMSIGDLVLRSCDHCMTLLQLLLLGSKIKSKNSKLIDLAPSTGLC